MNQEEWEDTAWLMRQQPHWGDSHQSLPFFPKVLECLPVGFSNFLLSNLFYFFNFVYLKHQCMVASCMPPTGDLACNPDKCPEWELNQWLFSSQASTQPITQHQPGLKSILNTPSNLKLLHTVPLIILLYWQLSPHTLKTPIAHLQFWWASLLCLLPLNIFIWKREERGFQVQIKQAH